MTLLLQLQPLYIEHALLPTCLLSYAFVSNTSALQVTCTTSRGINFTYFILLFLLYADLNPELTKYTEQTLLTNFEI